MHLGRCPGFRPDVRTQAPAAATSAAAAAAAAAAATQGAAIEEHAKGQDRPEVDIVVEVLGIASKTVAECAAS